MAQGPGKYDDLATICMELTGAELVMVVVAGGQRGSGFSMQARGPEDARLLAAVLRQIAEQIERDIS